MSNLKNLTKVKSIDLEKYDGKKATIEKVELLDVESKDFGEGLIETRQILVTTSNIAESGEDIPITAREYISLRKDKEGNWGYSDGKHSSATKMLTFFDAKDFEELIGKDCLVIRKTRGQRIVLGINFG